MVDDTQEKIANKLAEEDSENISSPQKKSKIASDDVPSSPTPAKMTPSKSPSISEDSERASARKQRQEIQEQKRLKEKLERRAAEEKEKEASAIRAAKLAESKALKRKQEEEKKEAARLKKVKDREKAALEKGARSAEKKKVTPSSSSSTLSTSSNNTIREKSDFKKEMKDVLKNCEKDIEKLEKEMAMMIKQEEIDIQSIETLKTMKSKGILQQIENEKNNKIIRCKLFQFVSGIFKPYELTQTILPEESVDWGTGELLRIHDTCMTFSKVLALTPFSLEELGCALRQSNEESVLVTCVANSFLRCILSPTSHKGTTTSSHKMVNVKLLEQPYDINMKIEEDNDDDDKKKNLVGDNEDMLGGLLPSTPPMEASTSLTWQSIMYHVLMRAPAVSFLLPTEDGEEEEEEKREEATKKDTQRTLYDSHDDRIETLKLALCALQKQEFHTLEFEYKLILLGCLSIQLLLGGLISEEISMRREQRIELEKQRKEEELEENRDKRSEKALLREEALIILREERKINLEKIAAQKDALDSSKTSGGGSGDMKQSTMDSFTTSSNSSSSSSSSSSKTMSKSTSLDSLASIGKSSSSSGSPKGSHEGDRTVAVASSKEWNPTSHVLVNKVKELEELKQIGGYRIKTLNEIDNDSGNNNMNLKQIEKELSEYKNEIDILLKEEKDDMDVVNDLKLSRTQLLQHRKDKDDLLKKAKQKLSQAENKYLEYEDRHEILLKLDRMNKNILNNQNNITSKKINQLLKEAREYNLEGKEDGGGLYCIPEIKELRKKLYDLKIKESKVNKDNIWLNKFDQLKVRREPLGVLIASPSPSLPPPPPPPSSSSSSSLPLPSNEQNENENTMVLDDKTQEIKSIIPVSTSSISFWCFGRDEVSKNSSKSKKEAVQEMPPLWIQFHSPLSTTKSGDSDPILGEMFSNRWNCINKIEKLKQFYHELNQTIKVSNYSDESLKNLSNAIFIQYYDELNDKANGNKTVGGEEEEEETEWKFDHEFIGCRVKRQYTVKNKILKNCGVIKGWLPAEENEGLALWHVKHDDYDSEDLEEDEAKESIQLWLDSDEKIEYDLEKQKESDELKEEEIAKQKAQEEEDDDDDGHNIKNKKKKKFISNIFEGKTNTWKTYMNKALPPKDRINEDDLGFNAFIDKLYKFEEGCFDFIKEKEKHRPSSGHNGNSVLDGDWSKGRNNIGPARSAWRLSLETSKTVSEISEVLITFEEFLRTFQIMEDIDDGGLRFKMMAKEGWLFGLNMTIDGKPDVVSTSSTSSSSSTSTTQPHEYVGKCVRQFYHGMKSDGKIVAYLPPDESDDESEALWHMIHVDGDEEDLDEAEVSKAIEFYDKNIQNENEDNKDEKDDEEEEDNDDGDGLQDSEEEEEEESSDEDDDEDDEDDEEEDESKRTLWATLGVRERWRSVVRKSKTISQLALALLILQEAATKFGIWNEIKSKEVRNLGSSSSSNRRSSNGSLLKQLSVSSGYGGRAAAQAARAKISKSAKEEQSIFNDDHQSNKRQRGDRSSSFSSSNKRKSTSSSSRSSKNKHYDKNEKNSNKKRKTSSKSRSRR